MAKLDKYREMRDFDATPEPAGGRPATEDGNRFVVVAGTTTGAPEPLHLVTNWDAELLRAVPVTLGLIENQFAELLTGELTEGQALVTGTESAHAPR